MKGERVSAEATVQVMLDILQNQFSLVDLSKLNKRQERSSMNAVAMGLMAYDDRGVALMNGERQKCEKILSSSLEKMRLEFTTQCPDVARALHSRLETRCHVTGKTAADHVRHMFKPLNSTSVSSCAQVTLRTLRNRQDTRAHLFLPLLLIELLADFHFYRDATRTDRGLQEMEENMGYMQLIPLALRELERQGNCMQGGQVLEPNHQHTSDTARKSTKKTGKSTKRRSTEADPSPKRLHVDASTVSEERPVAVGGYQGVDLAAALDDHLLQPSTPWRSEPLGTLSGSGSDWTPGSVAQGYACDSSDPNSTVDNAQYLDILDVDIPFSGTDMMDCMIIETTWSEWPEWPLPL